MIYANRVTRRQVHAPGRNTGSNACAFTWSRRVALALTALLLAACNATYPVNPPLSHVNPADSYDMENVAKKTAGSNEVLLMLMPEDAGLPLSDYLALSLAQRHGLEEPGYVEWPRHEQGELPISA